MKKNIFGLCLLLFTITTYAQQFTYKLDYLNSYAICQGSKNIKGIDLNNNRTIDLFFGGYKSVSKLIIIN